MPERQKKESPRSLRESLNAQTVEKSSTMVTEHVSMPQKRKKVSSRSLRIWPQNVTEKIHHQFQKYTKEHKEVLHGKNSQH
jgi:hypothetical protein